MQSLRQVCILHAKRAIVHSSGDRLIASFASKPLVEVGARIRRACPVLSRRSGIRPAAVTTPATLVPIQRGFARITIAIPPSTAADANRRCRVTGSPSRMTPPIVAMAGTLSCTVAAVVALRPCSAVYQIA